MRRRDFIVNMASAFAVGASAVTYQIVFPPEGDIAGPDDTSVEIKSDLSLEVRDERALPDLTRFKDITGPRIPRDDVVTPEVAKDEIVPEIDPASVPVPTRRPMPRPDTMTREVAKDEGPVIQNVPRPRPRPDYIPPAIPRVETEPKPETARPRRTEEAELKSPSILRAGNAGRVMLYNIHTSEKLTLDFRDVDKRAYNRFMRDHRRNEVIDIDNRLVSYFGKVVKKLRDGGATVNEVQLISGYRSPATNAMLQKTRGGQATNSLHTVGRAKDHRIPGVRLSLLQRAAAEVARSEGRGGVGYYPNQSSNFVHIDSGKLRFW